MLPIHKHQWALALMLLAVSVGIQAQSGSATINFHVQAISTATAIQGATITLTGPQPLTQTTDSSGNATLNIPYGDYTITISSSACKQIGPQTFIVDDTAPSDIVVNLQC